MSTDAEYLVKNGPVVAEIFGGICRFFPSLQKGAFVTVKIFGNTGPKFTKFVYYVEELLSL